MIERANKTIVQMLSHFVSLIENQTDWDDHLCYVLAAYRSTQHKSMGCTPNLLMLGNELDCPIDLMVGLPLYTTEVECPIEYVQWVKTSLRQSYEFAFDQLNIAASRQKKYYERDLKPREFLNGYWVWRCRESSCLLRREGSQPYISRSRSMPGNLFTLTWQERQRRPEEDQRQADQERRKREEEELRRVQEREERKERDRPERQARAQNEILDNWSTRLSNYVFTQCSNWITS
ncbi:uncharacterized protein LOC132754103 [Ruditapes philippinarum]|uniref:uncharacterized protein LOC132754103 n=1 Tax=Ruditapes philippinarum TaxID=129788 RepID=UPI00295BFD70|nr:uncharacterized protein LOC132754103 [Ruditapes philippinarum]